MKTIKENVAFFFTMMLILFGTTIFTKTINENINDESFILGIQKVVYKECEEIKVDIYYPRGDRFFQYNFDYKTKKLKNMYIDKLYKEDFLELKNQTVKIFSFKELEKTVFKMVKEFK